MAEKNLVILHAINCFCDIYSQARLQLLPHRTGELNIVGVVYDLAAASSGDMVASTEGNKHLFALNIV